MSKPSAAFEGVVPTASSGPIEHASSLAPAGHSVVVSDATPPSSPLAGLASPRATTARAPITFGAKAANTPPGGLTPPATLKGIDANGLSETWDDSMGEGDMVLELADGLALSGHSFGANKSVAGECVFQTGEEASESHVKHC